MRRSHPSMAQIEKVLATVQKRLPPAAPIILNDHYGDYYAYSLGIPKAGNKLLFKSRKSMFNWYKQNKDYFATCIIDDLPDDD